MSVNEEFDHWFQHYCLMKTESCLDRDILRWAKPILQLGFEKQQKLLDATEGTEESNDIGFKGTQNILDAIVLLKEIAKDLKTMEYSSVGKGSEMHERIKKILSGVGDLV